MTAPLPAPAAAARPASARGVPPRVLLVDDERLVLDALSVKLRRLAEVTVAVGAAEALRRLEQGPEFEVVVSDMRMPGISGAAFLAEVRRRWPDTTRMLLTGFADVETAVAAVNDGHIFRFLTKPCPPEVLAGAIDAGSRQFRLLRSEQELLEHTVRGAVDTLSEVLELVSPAAFTAGRRIRTIAVAMGQALPGCEPLWALELAALLGELGAVALPPETAQRVYTAAPLSPEEEAMVARVPLVSERLVARIPRLELVREAMQDARSPAAGTVLGRVLRVAAAYYRASTLGLTFPEAFARLEHDATFDRAALDALAQVQGLARRASRVCEVPVLGLRPGMVLADDVLATGGGLLLGKGHLLSDHVLERLLNCARGAGVQGPVRVWQEAEGS